MGKVFKGAVRGVGKAIKGAGTGVGKFAGGIGAGLRKVPVIGSSLATPFSLTQGIGQAIGGQNARKAFGRFGKGALQTAAIAGGALAAPGLVGAAGKLGLPGLSQVAGAGRGVLGTIGKTFTDPRTGGIDLGRVAGVGLGASQILGAGQQRRGAAKAAQSQTDLRNQLLSRILQGGGQQQTAGF